MKLLLIRHGETVDNVAQLYAGRRDSDLTNHGFQQATHLGRHFRDAGLRFTHIFASPLRRARKTAELVREAQAQVQAQVQSTSLSPSSPEPARTPPPVTCLSLLQEQDFGSLEGTSYLQRAISTAAGRNDGSFVPAESKEAMAARADAFLDAHLLPLVLRAHATDVAAPEPVVAIVSHGIFLSVLWRRLLRRLPPASVGYAPELRATRAGMTLEHLGGWSNTGYLELLMERVGGRALVDGAEGGKIEEKAGEVAEAEDEDEHEAGKERLHVSTTASTVDSGEKPGMLYEWKTTIMMVNGKAHLDGLKRTRGGVGSARHDESQKSITSFFKRRRME